MFSVTLGILEEITEAAESRSHVITANHSVAFRDGALLLPIYLLTLENADHRSGLPKNVLESNMPVVQRLVVIVLMFLLADTSTISAFEIWISHQAMKLPFLSFLMIMRSSSEWILDTANWTT
jgi:hypothetical protein